MALVLEIEYLLGVAFAAIGPDRTEADWPPQPDRVFSALVAAWAARGQAPAERAALEWLEAQEPPLIAYSSRETRPAPRSYVPPNDPSSKLKGNLQVLPCRRKRHDRRFPAALPTDPVVRLVWPAADGPHLAALDAMARDVPYVGHSASLTRCRFITSGTSFHTQPARRRIYRGRLRELEAYFAAGQRPRPGQDIVPPALEPAHPPDWLVLQIAEAGAAEDELTIDLRAAPVVCKALLKAVMSGYGRSGIQVPEWVSGHHPDGTPSRQCHLAAVPLAFVGSTYADGTLHGLALIPPPGHDLLADADFVAAMRMLVPDGGDAIKLTLGARGHLRLTPVFNASMASLRPGRYCATARQWTTATPIVLDHHLKDGDGPREIAAIIAASAVRATGVPVIRVVADKHAAVIGAPSATPSARAPRWTGWTVPDKLRSRRLTHATIVFERPVTGPVMIGAGRFVGLGLCLPVAEPPQ